MIQPQTPSKLAHPQPQLALEAPLCLSLHNLFTGAHTHSHTHAHIPQTQTQAPTHSHASTATHSSWVQTNTHPRVFGLGSTLDSIHTDTCTLVLTRAQTHTSLARSPQRTPLIPPSRAHTHVHTPKYTHSHMHTPPLTVLHKNEGTNRTHSPHVHPPPHTRAPLRTHTGTPSAPGAPGHLLGP